MSIHKQADGICKIRWQKEGGIVVRSFMARSRELAKKILRKKMSIRDENRHLDVKKEVNFRMSALIDRYWEQHGSKKKSHDREKGILKGIREELGGRLSGRWTVLRWISGIETSQGLKDYRRELPFATLTSCTT